MIGVPQNKNPDPFDDFDVRSTFLGVVIFIVFAIAYCIIERAIKYEDWEIVIKSVAVVGAMALSWWLGRFIIGRKRND